MIRVEIMNQTMPYFLEWIEESEGMINHSSTTSQVLETAKLAGIMSGTIVYDLFCRMQSKYNKYKSKPSFKMNLSRQQAAALVFYHRVHKCTDVILLEDLIKPIGASI